MPVPALKIETSQLIKIHFPFAVKGVKSQIAYSSSRLSFPDNIYSSNRQ